MCTGQAFRNNLRVRRVALAEFSLDKMPGLFRFLPVR